MKYRNILLPAALAALAIPAHAESYKVALDGTSGSAAASSDVLVSFAVGAEAVDFSIVVQSNASASAGVKLDVRVADANTTSSGLRSANATTSVLDTDKSGASLDFAILPEETRSMRLTSLWTF